jgi:hypothetical protein
MSGPGFASSLAVPGTINFADINRLDAIMPTNPRTLQLALRLTF